MPIVTLPTIWIVLLDIVAWAFFHLFISFICYKLPLAYFRKDSFWSRIFSWEESGKIWQRLFKVKKWKGSLLDGTVLFRKGYTKKKLHGGGVEDLEIFAAETKRAELTHWLSIVPAPLFLLWNPVWVGGAMVFYAFAANLPFIIVQRYNRGRILTIISEPKVERK